MTRTIISTDLGDIEADLFTEGAPKAAQNFIDLAKKGFYDDVIFHRVIPGSSSRAATGSTARSRRSTLARSGRAAPATSSRTSRSR